MDVYTCIIAVLFCFSLHVTHTSSQQSKCPEELRNCSCSSVRLACDLRGYTTFPENISPQYAIQDLSLSQNNLTKINDVHFKYFTHLRYLNLRANKIATVSGEAFDHTKMIHMIDLSRNRLSSLPINLFKCLKLLEDVYLGENQLKVIDSAHFSGLVNLKRIRLHDNQLTKIGSDAFLDSPGITELYLENNKLETPERNWLLHFDYTEPSGYELYLDGNPWSCDCRMKKFYDWAIRKKWFTSDSSRISSGRVSIPRCHNPEKLRGLQISSLDSSNKLICTGVNITSKSSDISIFEGESLILECKGSGFPIPTVSLLDPQGIILSSNANAVKYILDTTSVSHSGLYRCHASGYENSNAMISVDSVIAVEVKKSKSQPIVLSKRVYYTVPSLSRNFLPLTQLAKTMVDKLIHQMNNTKLLVSRKNAKFALSDHWNETDDFVPISAAKAVLTSRSQPRILPVAALRISVVGGVCLLAFLVLLGLGALCYKRCRPDEVSVEKVPPNDAKATDKNHEIPKQHDDDLPYWQKDTEYLV